MPARVGAALRSARGQAGLRPLFGAAPLGAGWPLFRRAPAELPSALVEVMTLSPSERQC